MPRFLSFGFLLIHCWLSQPVLAAEQLSQEQTDAIVTKFQSDYAATFNRRDAIGMAALMTADATMVNEWGGVTKGNANILNLLKGLMSHLPEGTTLRDTALANQSIASGVIVSQGLSKRMVPGSEPVQMIFSRVLVLENAEWKLAAMQIARPSTVPKP